MVAPLTLIVSGVLNGSDGPLYYPPEEVQRNPTVWNNVPIVVYHPNVNGQAVSAKEPSVMTAQGIGTIFNATTKDGSLVAEAWFDIEHTERVDNRVLVSLRANKPIEVSTGLSLDRKAVEGTTEKGVPYSFITSNYRPDHLAILPDQVGACSNDDGCGVLIGNASKLVGFTGTRNGHSHVVVINREGFGTAQTEDNHTHQIKKFVVQFADNHDHDLEKSSLLNSNRKTRNKENSMELTENQRKKIVDNLVTNDCCWEEDDRETLNAFSDTRLTKMKEAAEKSAGLELVANAATKGFEDELGNKHIFNAEKNAFLFTKRDDDEEDDEEEDDENKKKTKNKGKKDMTKNEKPTEEEWLASAPASVREDLLFARNEKHKQKTELVDKLVANVRDEQQQAKLTDNFMRMAISDLQDMVAILPEEVAPANNFAGAATPASVTENAQASFAAFSLPENQKQD